MQKISIFLGLLSTNALGGIVFRDIRPQSYLPQRRLNILSGKLYSTETAISKEFYWLNYCPTTSLRGGYSDDWASRFADSEYIEGVTMYDSEIHETFMDYKVTLDKENEYACERILNDFQY